MQVAGIVGRMFIMSAVTSEPTEVDTDGDGVQDAKDPWPMICCDYTVLNFSS